MIRSLVTHLPPIESLNVNDCDISNYQIQTITPHQIKSNNNKRIKYKLCVNIRKLSSGNIFISTSHTVTSSSHSLYTETNKTVQNSIVILCCWNNRRRAGMVWRWIQRQGKQCGNARHLQGSFFMVPHALFLCCM